MNNGFYFHICSCDHERVQHRASIRDTWEQCFECECNQFARRWIPEELYKKGKTNG